MSRLTVVVVERGNFEIAYDKKDFWRLAGAVGGRMRALLLHMV